ncbi:hypothetical protein KXD97_19815 [Mycobacterium sp. SMC-8]|uniref:hypothetical protein n=1 Tax=Mycobacterium sp. SMC-8 TaxID=2857060 RepID=UPI0021B374B8|nr:hypothetical protein [Mycobacterium sp. SMC-8]UXA10373.1 hypothetical protein KXD97_19815 [Mycobacterium sp. SMC-8]
MKIRFLRVLGSRAQHPTVLAIADDYAVRWDPKDDWSCTCDELTFPECPHVDAVEALLDPRVTGPKKK